ncbi:Ankyrin repeat-containing protein [Glarea lozoyensis ATCC 20868]|uniref:Ankyrin repeat-containing protein n=1 Tax=Glarea lozoyensis (strain ATCC 20868 / MF5171) TaxID=1116229 RepID=S3DNI0_GLAL2|nr:Ankyrin repeat-containing protein [Glarea lozoyensis ATCC 20868]EPE33651.1 Ankyrin repeat-containing protein [Glarea lozoyensis ATCC 20868]
MPGVKIFLDHPVGKNPPRDWNELHYAAFVKDFDKVRAIVEYAPHLVEAKDLAGWTPVHLACCGPMGFALDISWALPHKVDRVYEPSRRRYRDAAYLLDEDNMQVESQKILALFIRTGADIFGEEGSYTPAHVAASTDMVHCAFTLALFGAQINPHKPGSPFKWANHQQKYLLSDLVGPRKLVSNMYHDLLGLEGQTLLEEFEKIASDWEDPNKQNVLTKLAFQIEYTLAISIAKYRRTIQVGSERKIVWLCSQCCKLGEEIIMRSFFPSSTRSITVPLNADMKCDLCNIFRVLFLDYVPGSVENLSYIITDHVEPEKQSLADKFKSILATTGVVHLSVFYDGKLVKLDSFLSERVWDETKVVQKPTDLNRASIDFDVLEGIFEDTDSTLSQVDSVSHTTFESEKIYHCKSSITRFPQLYYDSSIGSGWLSRCRVSHPNCSKMLTSAATMDSEMDDGTFTPTRLIDVSRWEENLIRICDCKKSKPLFTALSHRWSSGPVPSWVTKTANLSLRYSWFSSVELPKSITDALQATAELGLQYTWIDSLCIVQDDSVDWNNEAAQMARIYASAEVVVFADCARNDEGGFLGERNPSTPYHPVALRLMEREDDYKRLPTIVRYAYEVPPWGTDEKDISDRSDYLNHKHAAVSFREDVNQSHLSNRGWILQERLMARRSLHFGASQVYWECPSMIVSEAGNEIDGEIHQKWIVDTRKALAGSTDSWEMVRQNWIDIVSVYSRMKLTKPFDRLPAIEGIARAFRSFMDDKYFYGTWLKSFPQDLLWQVDSQKSVDPNTKHQAIPSLSSSDRIPSWSWASVNTPMSFVLTTPRVGEGGCVPDCSAKCYQLSLPLESISAINSRPMIGVLGFHTERFLQSKQISGACVTIKARMLELLVIGPTTSKLGYLEPGSIPLYDDELAPVGIALFDEPELQGKCDSPKRVLCVLISTSTAYQLSERHVVDFMLILEDCGDNSFVRIGVSHTNIRQTSRYDTGSIFKNCKLKTITLF